MENCGFEDESTSVYNIADDFSSAPPKNFSSIPEERAAENSKITLREFLSNDYEAPRHPSNPDAHVYEDISPGYGSPEDNLSAGSNSERNSPFWNDNPGFSPLPETMGTPRADRHGVFNLSKDVTSCIGVPQTRITNSEISATDVITRLHRTLTLPAKRSSRVFAGSDQGKNSSVRVTRSEKGVAESRVNGEDGSEVAARTGYSAEEILADESPSRRRRKKKDCKHCKNKKAIGGCDREMSPSLTKESHENCGAAESRLADDSSHDIRLDASRTSSRLEPVLALPRGKLPNFFTPNRSSCRAGAKPSENTAPSIYSLSNNSSSSSSWNLSALKPLNYDKNEIQARLTVSGETAALPDSKALITPQKNRATMKVNSIYSQDQWGGKETPIFFTDIKEQDHFQRAYSLPSRSQTPSSQNRANLRRSVRGEPPPRPARLDKHRGGWTLHFARPLRRGGCTKSIIVIVLIILLLLGVGCTALYIFFEPQKLQVIQQYLMASAPNATAAVCDSCTKIQIHLDDSNKTINSSTSVHSELTTARTTTTTTSTTTTMQTVIWSPETTVIPEPETNTTENSASPTTATTPTTTSLYLQNTTRYCDDCVSGEVCVALITDEVPICRTGPDPKDPTGCAGLCLINIQRCHRLDVDAFRCAELEHHCLDGEWTCSNGLCIPVVKRCDGHMNCYDHSDEYECDCDLKTHFRCGNETSCLPLERRCDGVINCWDATDEINCTVACPLESEFTCNSGQCISKMRFCDGLPDCTDGSDEPHGCQGRCNKHEFTCGNGRCIAKDMKCNKIDDCGDGTDERRCRDRGFT